ncbi:hypothetical protein DSO57_1024598 [Entomophthora muscae]|uniref:Uncharacterized protein n=1 Tax=Entomophthora muscae TaxID=34485 RepID=A0ACC2TQ44_9FUNG|nr:hypothetical protein DSO57_1024598 [Entomophthora muscae]
MAMSLVGPLLCPVLSPRLLLPVPPGPLPVSPLSPPVLPSLLVPRCWLLPRLPPPLLVAVQCLLSPPLLLPCLVLLLVLLLFWCWVCLLVCLCLCLCWLLLLRHLQVWGLPGLLAGVLTSESGQLSPVCAYSTQHVVLSSSDKEDALSGVDRPSPSHQTPKRKGTQRGQVGGKRHQLNAWGYEVVAGKRVPYQTQQQAFSDDSNQPYIALLQSLNFQLPPPPPIQ